MYKINELPTPCFVIDEGKLEENLKRQKSLKDQLMEVFNFIENVVYKDNGCRQ